MLIKDLPLKYRILCEIRSMQKGRRDFFEKTRHSSLKQVFVWVNTPDGEDFWISVYFSGGKELLPKLNSEQLAEIQKFIENNSLKIFSIRIRNDI